MKEAESEYSSSIKRSFEDRMDKKRSEYFQSIARYFFKQRGAPFFLSSKELDLVETWERMKIPLQIVLEGIKRAFESAVRKPRRMPKIRSLAYCNLYVLKAFEQYRERKVGHKKRIVEREEKRDRARTEVQMFLKTIPSPIGYLKEPYSRAHKILSKSPFDEEELERIEGEVEELLWKNSPNEERGRVKKELKADCEFRDEEEFLRIFRIKLVKALRDKHKIPYISLFYY